MKEINYEVRGGICYTMCPYQKHTGVNSGECHSCEHFVKSDYKNRILTCKYDDDEGLSQDGSCEPKAKPELVNHPDYYNRYSVEVVEMARRIWGDEAMKAACEITAFIYRMRAGIKPDNPVEQDIREETWWLDKYKEICQK